MGPELWRYRSELAARLGRGRPVLRIPDRSAADCLYDQRDRGAELEAQTSGPGGHFPNDDAAMKLLYLILNRSEKSGRCRLVNEPWQRPSSPSCSVSALPKPWWRNV